MSILHLHLLLNHVPVVGAALVVSLLMLAVFRNSSQLAKTALGVAIAIGAVSLIVYFTGEPAEDAVENLIGVSEDFIDRHESAALVATLAAGAFGVVALGILAWFRGRNVTRLVTASALAGSLVLAGTMAWTANLGGQIRHSEIRSGTVASSAGETGAEGDDEEKNERTEPERKDR